jgi:hypothetical protein
VCTGNTFTFVVVGGSGSINIVTSPAGAIIEPSAVVPAGGGSFTVRNLANKSGDTTVTAVDSGTPRQTATATITCS